MVEIDVLFSTRVSCSLGFEWGELDHGLVLECGESTLLRQEREERHGHEPGRRGTRQDQPRTHGKAERIADGDRRSEVIDDADRRRGNPDNGGCDANPEGRRSRDLPMW
ncbi:hypothetical protein [Cryobacterium sp. PH31-L1]|uniref:hypothetical protein n=1 Tax=Cryobacterium sp. PH31-L1 TaxID=3046199 RepID=UPI0024BA8E4C|nr:hypothetical protein [Cryobacterium sp. PH31-L1]MDJ0377958.1 hypothetical protein [Cryobacterium sp. PH31-L1]